MTVYCPADDKRCSKSAQKSAVQACQVASVMETTQLVLSVMASSRVLLYVWLCW